LRDAEGELHATGVDDVLEIDEHALRGLGAEVGDRRAVGHGADVRLEHHVKGAGGSEAAGLPGSWGGDQGDLVFAGLGEVFGDDGRKRALDGFLALEGFGGGLEFAGGVFALESGDVTDGLRDAVGAGHNNGEKELVRAKALFAHLAVDERVGEAGDVAGGFPNLRVHDDRSLDADDVVAAADHVGPPAVADVLLQLGTEGAVVEEAVEAAVDLGRLENKAAALRERDKVVHRNESRCGRGGRSGV